MKILIFSKRIMKEIVREPINLFFGLVFPLILLLLLSTIQKNVPVDLFKIETLIPAVAVFGLSFMTLFLATIISKDRNSAFLQRLYTSPMKTKDFIFGYTLPIIPLSIAQIIICYVFALIFGLKINAYYFLSIATTIIPSLFFISLGLLFGSLLNEKAVGGICGALLTNLTAWFSGAWFDLELVGGAFKKISECLPFYHAVQIGRKILTQNMQGLYVNLLVVGIYTVIITITSMIIFKKQMLK